MVRDESHPENDENANSGHGFNVTYTSHAAARENYRAKFNRRYKENDAVSPEDLQPGEFQMVTQRMFDSMAAIMPTDFYICLPNSSEPLLVALKLFALNPDSLTVHTSLWRAVAFALEASQIRNLVYVQLVLNRKPRHLRLAKKFRGAHDILVREVRAGASPSVILAESNFPRIVERITAEKYFD